MQVKKVLNNSLVLVTDKFGRELILMGKGIGFNKAVGYKLKDEEIEKVFVLKDENISKNIIQLASEIDATYFEIAEQAIKYAISTYDMELMEHIYLGLTDHISYAVKRARLGIEVQNFYTENLKLFNPDEFEVGVYTCKLMEERTGIKFSIDECSNIAFHFINAQQNNPYSIKNQKINGIVKGILDIVKYSFNTVFDEDNISYIRFTSHLKRFAQRIINLSQDMEVMDDIVFDNIFETCYKEYYCVKKIGIFIKEKYHTELSKHEELYLTLHLHRILEESSLKSKLDGKDEK